MWAGPCQGPETLRVRAHTAELSSETALSSGPGLPVASNPDIGTGREGFAQESESLQWHPRCAPDVQAGIGLTAFAPLFFNCM